MVNKIIFSTFVICLFIAIPLSIMGYEKVELGEPFLALMSQVTKDLQDFKIEIPNIPTIPTFENASGMLIVLDALIKFINVIIFIINALVGVINVIIELLQTIFLFVKALVNFKDTIASTNVPVV